jgi:hypothetical protein
MFEFVGGSLENRRERLFDGFAQERVDQARGNRGDGERST